MDAYIAEAQKLITTYWIRIVAAITILIAGKIIAAMLRRLATRILTKANVDETLVRYGAILTNLLVLIVVILAALNQLGVQTTSLIAILGAAGLAIGLAVKDSLSNLAAGVMLITFRPFRLNDWIEGGGTQGTVEAVNIFTTQLRTGDNRTVTVPNSKLISDNIINYTKKGTRRIDLVIGVSYSDDLSKVKSVFNEILAADKRILTEPEPVVAVLALAESSVNIAVRPWTRAADYWSVHFDLIETIKNRCDAEGINIPFPQRDLHIVKQ